MDKPLLLTRVENLCNLYKKCKEENGKLKSKNTLYAKMNIEETFPDLNNSNRLTPDNVKIGDIIRCLVLKKPLYSVVNSINNSCVSVVDLTLIMNGLTVEFHRKTEVNSTHKGNLNFSRKILLINRNEYTTI
tara:strand:+ start:208 stop:603 length:396 start_codon:yes stop_codon:yes gene_type:complete